MKSINKIISSVLCLIFILCTNWHVSANAKKIIKGYMGYYDNNMTVSSADPQIMNYILTDVSLLWKRPWLSGRIAVFKK